MFERVLILVTFYFLLGGILVSFTNKRKPEGKRERWKKYWFYLLIVYLVLLLAGFHPQYFYLLGIIIALVGYYEMIAAWRDSGTSFLFLVASLLIYSSVVLYFLWYCYFHNKTGLVWLYMLVLTFDGFSQLSGQLFGKKRIAGRISPNKTLEGLLGGFSMTVLTAFGLREYFAHDLPPVMYFLFVLTVCCFAFAGDLAASAYKRQCGIKDYSRLIPGHGGVLDRFDSFIGAAAGSILFYHLVFHSI